MIHIKIPFKPLEKIEIKYKDVVSPVIITKKSMKKIGSLLLDYVIGDHIALISDSNVAKIYGDELIETIKSEGLIVHHLCLEINNSQKKLSTVEKIYRFLTRIKADGATMVVLLGGNVLIDCAGFAAVTFHRGLRYVNIPTTLLSQVDGAIGGVLGVHYRNLTNYVGARQLPEFVWVDLSVLVTLPIPEIRCGIAEIIKQAAVSDQIMFEMIENVKESQLKDINFLSNLVVQTVKHKAKLVKTGDDEYLNFGHTIGHAIENLMKHKGIRHGEAVSIGMCYEIALLESIGGIKEGAQQRLRKILKGFSLPTDFPQNIINRFKSKQYLIYKLFKMVYLDKKVYGGELFWVMPSGEFGKGARIKFSENQLNTFIKKSI
ncbi:MAG: 3-dehydroquinate synthase [Desulfobacterales bacterium]|nr:3-dehydroquinate synthase [Desulfobacterales bacterium]